MNKTIHFDGYEYRVPHPDDTEAAAYYTDDKVDAVDTFAVMWDGHDAEPVIRRVDELPNIALPEGF